MRKCEDADRRNRLLAQANPSEKTVMTPAEERASEATVQQADGRFNNVRVAILNTMSAAHESVSADDSGVQNTSRCSFQLHDEATESVTAHILTKYCEWSKIETTQ